MFNITPPQKEGSETFVGLLILAHRLIGKTSAIVQLPNALLIDLEGHSTAYESKCDIINVKKNLKELNDKRQAEGKDANEKKPIHVVTYLKELAKHLKSQPKKYDFIIWDTLTTLEQLAIPLANKLFRETSDGVNYTGKNVVTDLGYGKGYLFLKQALEEILQPFEGLANVCPIYLGHVSTKMQVAQDREIEMTDIDLTSQAKKLFTGTTSGTGIMYRSANGSQNIITFINRGDSLVVGGRL